MNRSIDEYIAKRGILSQSCNNIGLAKANKKNSNNSKLKEEKEKKYENHSNQKSSEKIINSSNNGRNKRNIVNCGHKKNLSASSYVKKQGLEEIARKFDLKSFLVGISFFYFFFVPLFPSNPKFFFFSLFLVFF